MTGDGLSSSTLPWIAAAGAAIWAGWQFLLRREAEPSADLRFDAVFVGSQHGQYLLEIVAILANRGLVRHVYRDFEVVVRYLLPEDAIEDGDERIAYQLRCARTINTRVGNARRRFANASYIDRGLTFRHSYITFVPATASFVWVQCRLEFMSWATFPFRRRPATKNTQQLFRVRGA
jgi:hypothetical protein